MKKQVTIILLALVTVAVPADALTKAQMQSLAASITNAGYRANLIPLDATNWKIAAGSNDVDIPIASANTLAVNAGVTAFVALAEFGPMTTAKMQTVANAITNAGYDATLIQVSVGSWRVRATSPDVNIPTSSVASLATSQAVAAFISDVEYR